MNPLFTPQSAEPYVPAAPPAYNDGPRQLVTSNASDSVCLSDRAISFIESMPKVTIAPSLLMRPVPAYALRTGTA
jgi:hypothetical protein